MRNRHLLVHPVCVLTSHEQRRQGDSYRRNRRWRLSVFPRAMTPGGSFPPVESIVTVALSEALGSPMNSPFVRAFMPPFFYDVKELVQFAAARMGSSRKPWHSAQGLSLGA
jgi:hypothetical protein